MIRVNYLPDPSVMKNEGEQSRSHQKLLLDRGPSDVGIVKSFSQIALGTIIYWNDKDSVVCSVAGDFSS